MTLATPKRHPLVAYRRLPLDEKQWEIQRQRGLYTVQRGEPFAIPVDRIHDPTVFLNRDLWRQDGQGRVFRPGVQMEACRSPWQRQALTWLRDHVHEDIPYWYYLATLGHDLHVSTWGELYGRQWRHNWTNPFEPECFDAPLDLSLEGSRGFTEYLGLLSAGKVTDVFVNVQVGAMVDSGGAGQAAEFNDFNEHEVGTSSQAESNNDTALIATSGIALVAGTQVDDGGDPPTMTTVATITADATETWEEHAVLSTAVDSLLDRSLTNGQPVVSGNQVEYTYVLTVNPEA